jgi:hypothetical protein
MKKKILTFTIICLVLTGKSIGQNLKGIWLSSHTLKIIKKHIPYQSDSILSSVNLILDFVDNENVILNPLSNKKKNRKFSINKKTIQINIDNLVIKGELTKNELILTLKDTVNYTNKIYLKRIMPSDLKTSQIPDSTMFFNSSWVIESDTNSENYGIKFNFLDRDSLDSFKKHRVIITKNRGSYGYTENGIYNILSYKKHFFLGILNKETFEESVYHFYKKDNNTFYADTYENSFLFNGNSPPKLNKIKFVKTKYLTSKQKNNLESKLKGKWKAINNPIPIDSIISKYKKLENQSFEITFKENNEYEIRKRGILINENIRVPKNIIITGKWKISETGNYIFLKPNNNRGKYLTIKNITNNSLKIYYNIEPLEKETITAIDSYLIELIK